jgi:hypothetical protein
MPTDARLLAMDLMLRAMREALEDALAPDLVSEALFEALDANEGEIPGTAEDLTRFVRSHLRDALGRRLGHTVAENAVRSLESLMPGSMGAGAPPAGASGPGTRGGAAGRNRSRPEHATVRMEGETGPVRALVVAKRPGLAACLHVALGRENVIAVTAGSVERIENAVDRMDASLVVVVADDLPDQDEVKEIAGALRGIPRHVQRVVWGHDATRSKRIAETLDAADQPAVTVDRAEGPAPLLDLFRARASARR